MGLVNRRTLALVGTAAGAYLAWRSRRPAPPPPSPALDLSTRGSRPRVVILGAGFGGIAAALRLARARGDGAAPEVVLLDRNNYHLFSPLLYQAAIGLVDPISIVHPVRAIAYQNGFRFRVAEVEGIDFAAGRVHTDADDVVFDYLIIALGATPNFYGLRDVAEQALSLKTIGEAVAIRNRVFAALERADAERDPERRRQILTFAIVGGGPTGLEFAGALAALIHDVGRREYPGIDPAQVTIQVLEATGEILPGMGPWLKEKAMRRLSERGVEIKLNTAIAGMQDGQLVTRDGQTITAETLIWAAGVRGSPLAERLPGERTRDARVIVNECLQIPGYPNVYAVGDNAAFIPSPGERPLPGTAPVAIQEATTAADNVLRQLRGEKVARFRYQHPGNLVILGRHAGAAEIRGINLDGLPAWLIWRWVHLTWLTGLRNKLEVLLDWSLLYVTPRQTAQIEAD